jgi:hypothetical protein
MMITRKVLAKHIREVRELAKMTPHFIMSNAEIHAKVYDACFAPFAWPGGYTVVFRDESGEMLCRDCAINHVYGYDTTDESESPQTAKQMIEKSHRVYSSIYWEGPDEACSDCGSALPSAYGEPDEDSSETA